MRVKAFVFILLTCILLSTAFVHASPADSVVKIRSYYKSAALQPRVGSGLLIKFKGKRFVLTSDHIVYHGEKSFTHEVLDSEGHAGKLKFLLSDAGKGFALLSFVEHEEDFLFFDFDNALRDVASDDEEISLMGFPADSDGLLVDSKAIIQSTRFPSALFVELETLIKVKSGHGEFGMSGGAAFSKKGTYRGILSHQIVENSVNHVLLISSQTVFESMDSLFDQDGNLKVPSPIALFQDPAQQASDFVSYRTKDLYMTAINPYGPSTPWGMELVFLSGLATESLYGGESGPLASIEKLRNTKGISLRFLGYRKNEILGSAAGVGSDKINLQLRTIKNMSIEPLWTIESSEKADHVLRAQKIRPSLLQLQRALNFTKAVRLSHYVGRVASLLQPAERDDSFQNTGLGAWRFLKPKDLDFILNDPSLALEWTEIESQSQGALLKLKLNELKKIMSALTF